MLPQPGKKASKQKTPCKKTQHDFCLKASYTAKEKVTASLLFSAIVTSSTHQQRKGEKMDPTIEKMRGSAGIAHRKEKA